MYPEILQEFPEIRIMDDVLNDVLNTHEHSDSEDSDGIYSETNVHENVIDSDLGIISSFTDSAGSQREHEEDHEVTTTNLGVIQPQTNSSMSILKAPKASSHARKLTQARNSPTGKPRCRGTSANEPKHIEPTQRVKEYKNEPFTITNKKLFCRACREVSVEKSIVKNHVKSSKHAKGKERMSKNEAQHKDLAGNTMMMFTFVEKHSCKHSKFIV